MNFGARLSRLARRFDLIGAADKRALFDGFRGQRGQRAGCDGLIEQPFGGADCIRAAPCNVAGGGQGFAEGIGDQSGCKPVSKRVFCGKIRPV